MAYNRNKFKPLEWQPTDWADLWRPELQGRISLLDQPREVIGLTLKKLGHSYNERSLKAIPQLIEHVRSLNQQTSFYSSSNYLQPLIVGDTWLAQGWSSDIILAMQQYPEIEMVVPRSGTALWADLWVQPQSAALSDLIAPWLDFCLDTDVMTQIARFSRGGTWTQAAPLNPLKGESAFWLDASVLNQSEFLQPLSESVAQDYQDIWNTELGRLGQV
jgi:putative spermidine/putrescine transport system substrate-binding protein